MIPVRFAVAVLLGPATTVAAGVAVPAVWRSATSSTRGLRRAGPPRRNRPAAAIDDGRRTHDLHDGVDSRRHVHGGHGVSAAVRLGESGGARLAVHRPAVRVGPSRPEPATLRRGSSHCTAIRSRSRTAGSQPGRACGASASPCLAPACWWIPSNANAPQPAAVCIEPVPDPPRRASTVCAVRACRKPWPSAP